MTLREPFDLAFNRLASLHPKQWAVLQAMCSRARPVILAGGSGYGGKSYMLRAAAIYSHLLLHSWGFRQSKTVFSAATYESLRDRHFDYFESEWGEWGSIRDGHRKYGRCFLFHNSDLGAICLRNLSAVRERKGTEYGAGFIDESTEILRNVFGDFLYMVRKPGVPHLAVVLASNPDGVGHAWNKALFRPFLPPNIEPTGGVDHNGRAEFLLSFPKERAAPLPTTVDPLQEEDGLDYIYIPFLPDDNPVFNEKLFWRMVAHLPEHVQRARRWGTWDAPEGARFPYLREQDQLFSLEDTFRHGIPLDWRRIVHVDYGLRAPYAALWTAVDYDGNYWTYREDYCAGLTADVQAKRIISLTRPDEVLNEGYLDPAMWSQFPRHQVGDSDRHVDVERSAAEYYEKIFKTANDESIRGGGMARFPVLQPGYNRSRVVALNTLDMLLRRGNGFPDWYIEQNCSALWGELTGAVFKQGAGFREYSEDIDERSPDHAITAAYYGFHNRITVPVLPRIDAPPTPQAIMKAAREKAERMSVQSFVQRSRKRGL